MQRAGQAGIGRVCQFDQGLFYNLFGIRNREVT